MRGIEMVQHRIEIPGEHLWMRPWNSGFHKPWNKWECRKVKLNECEPSPFSTNVQGIETILSYKKCIRVYFLCGSLMDFNEARLHEATLNLHTHPWMFPLSIAPVDDKQHLSEVLFSALVGFSLYTKVQTMTKQYYRNVLRWLRDAVRHKRQSCGQQAIGASIKTMLQSFLMKN